MRIGNFGMLVVAAVAGLLSACSIKLPNLDASLNKVKLTCSAVVDPAAGSIIASGAAVPIQVKASGGVAPYQIFDSTTTFNPDTVISRTYTNTTASNITVNDTVMMKDNLGLVGQCGFSVTIAPAGTVPSNLACTLAGTPSSPVVGQNVSFLATASGGTAPYAFSQFTPGADSTIVTALASASSTTATATAKFNTVGLRTPSVKLTDNTGTAITCSQSINAVAAPSVSVIASPATSVVVGNSITLTATPAGFSATPTYVFSTTRSGITLSWSGNTATVTSSVAQSAFDVVVTATAGSQTATSVISLGFVANSSLACSIVHPSGLLYPGQTVNFSVVAANGESLLITYFATHSDGVTVASSNSSRSIVYSVPGIKNVLLQAKSTTSGALCQAGAVLSDTIEISAPVVPTLTCNAYTSVNPAYTYQYFTTWAAISGGQGTRWVDSLTVMQNSTPVSTYTGSWQNSTSAQLMMYYAGSYQIQLNVKDSYGNTGSCTTTQVIW